ncbi:MAG: thioredoxin domain-containing protein [Acidobacteria bacterium]|nr:thioredoxin domain-containing protein [Acidobacteriota bacterium]
MTFDGTTYTNRLIDSHDPYLLMHAHNPVDWYPWGPEAIEKARRENKPIFLSVGYSTCYWCHVAEREIYSNPDIAALMNRWFVNIKVDREERPDVDGVYMLATQIMTGAGGWPNNVFLTPDLKPFFAGSYFPPTDQGGRTGFPSILTSLHDAWTGERAKVTETSARVYQALQQAESRPSAAGGAPLAPESWLAEAVKQAAAQFDGTNSGFRGGSTMFPEEPVLSALLSDARLTHDRNVLNMVTATLQAMAEGGVMDQLAGGFHRYSTEPTWSIPHFEKMLYDNAQLLAVYAQAYAITGRPFFKLVARRTAHYLTTEMQAEGGGFYSAQDSQIDGVEGVSYVWTKEQIQSVLGAADTRRFLALYMLTPMPESFGGQKPSPGGVLRLDRDKAQVLADKDHLAAAVETLAPLRDKLLAARSRRPQPARDEKIVIGDNALAILGFLQAGQALDNPALTRTATDAARWAWNQAFDASTGLLRHQFFQDHAGGGGFLDDYALLGQAFLALHEITGEAEWRTRAQQVADAMLTRFARPDGSLATTADASDLLVAPPADGDSVQPAGQSATVALLLGLGAEGGHVRYATAGRRALAPLSGQIAARPYDWGALLAWLSQPPLQTALNRAEPAAGQPSAGLPGSADHVPATASLLPRRAAGKQSAELRVVIDIDPGYHINANPASDRNLIPTELTFVDGAKLHVDYPPAETFRAPFAPQGIAVYSGRIELRALVPGLPASTATLKLRVQACNDQYCLAPATLELPVSLKSK